MKPYVCVHGHFYQPPRENPWLEEIEIQDSAYPYHDWNERITTECYAPNTASRILTSQKKITDVVNNYAKMSFNFGPTLLSWMEKHAPGVYQAILTSDRISQERFSGHGSALAQCYNHMIMPLSNRRDKWTQIVWGVKDFEFRYGRKPEGMWLPETAVDLESLELLADAGIRFTLLAPHQAKQVRAIGSADWVDVSQQRVDPKRPYICQLPHGKSMVIFFYDGVVSQDVAFRGLLNNGEGFAQRLLGAIPADPSEPLLEHIATDGESYGHHHRFGDMALAYCFHYLEKNHLAELTIYGEFLQKHPPLSEVQIFENSSWSCSHGVERWRANCGCNSGGRPGWSQAWRGPLRDTLDWLRDQLAPVYEQEMRSFCADPWALRDQYIDVVLDRSEDNIRQFFQKNFVKVVSDEDRSRCLKLLEIQRHAMLMYTSCGWFFDELSGIETTQILQYAARCLQLVKELTEVDLEPEFRTRLKSAPSNVPELKDGTQVYDIFVRPKIVNIFRVGVHYALATVFEGFPDEAEIFCYSIKREFFKHHTREGKHLVTGKATIRSYITLETQTIYFASVYMGKSELRAGVSANLDDERFLKLRDGLEKMFEAGEDLHLVDLLRQEFQDQIYSLWHLFKNTQEKVLNKILEPTMGEMRRLFRHIYEHHFPLVQAKKDMRISLPKALAATVEFVLNRDLREMLQREYLDLEDLKKLVDEVKRWSFELDNASLSFAATEKINGLIQTLEKDPENVEVLKNIENILKTLKVLSLAWDRWKSQNIYFSIGKRFLKNMQDKSAQGDANATQWVASFNALGAYLEV